MVTSVDVLCKEYEKPEVPEFGAGDTVRVHVRVVEGNRERIQVFEGAVIRYRGGGSGTNFTVRRVASHGIGVERIFLLHSPRIERIEVVRRGKVRRAQLYYLRGRTGTRCEDQGAPAPRPAAARCGRIILTRLAPPFPRRLPLLAARPTARTRAYSWGWRVRGRLAPG